MKYNGIASYIKQLLKMQSPPEAICHDAKYRFCFDANVKVAIPRRFPLSSNNLAPRIR
jgi:hypothetical protein